MSTRFYSGVKTAIPGFTSCQYELVDSVSKLLSLKAEISGDQLGEKWSFLKNWNSLKIGQKVKIVDETFSYELGILLYKKDREFFEVTIKDFIKCRVKKNIIDYYLLEETDVLVGYLTSPTKIAQLNAIEKICLIDALSSSHPVQCQSLLQSLQGEDATNSYEGTLAFSSIFDRLINSGDKRGEKVQLKQVGGGKKAYRGDYEEECSEKDAISESSGSQDSMNQLKPKMQIQSRRDPFQHQSDEDDQPNFDLFGEVEQECCVEEVEQVRKPQRYRRNMRQKGI